VSTITILGGILTPQSRSVKGQIYCYQTGLDRKEVVEHYTTDQGGKTLWQLLPQQYLHLQCSLPIIHLLPLPNLAHQPHSFFRNNLPRCRVSLPPSFVLLLIANSGLCSWPLWFIPQAWYNLLQWLKDNELSNGLSSEQISTLLISLCL
jgi:hypothetical protein